MILDPVGFNFTDFAKARAFLVAALAPPRIEPMMDEA